ncbi:MAG: YqhA family protein [Parashewanella sp.]
MEQRFESLLWGSRLLLIFGVICCVITAATLIALGCAEVFHLLHEMFTYLFNSNSGVSRDKLILIVIEILDTFLLSSILFIFSFGLYELFISSIENSQHHQSKAFQINSIDQLKAKLGNVVVMLLVIKLFSYLVEIKPTNIIELLYMALIVLLVSLSLWLGHLKK